MKSGRFIGVMSGTSLDGVDVVLATIDEHRVAQLASLSWPIPPSLKQAVLDICRGQQLTLSQFGQLDTQLGRLFADAVNALLKEENLQPKDIVAIGCHGQTVWHEPTGVAPHTLQIGDNNQIVARTGITVVGDFRRRDIARVDRAHRWCQRFIMHCWLILLSGVWCSTLVVLPICHCSFLGNRWVATIPGPGNMLMDAWIWRQAGKPYDKDAEWARAGKVILPLLQNMVSDAYFSQPAPKSTGREYFNYGWLERHLRQFPGVDARDVQATLVELTAVTISEQVLLSGGCDRLMVCGGGSRNPLVMTRLAALLPGTEVTTTDAVGISGDDMEALAFAWLAWRTLAGLPGNLPSVTGASEATVLGAIFPANPRYQS